MYFPVAAAGYFVYGDLFITENTDYILDIIYKGVIHKIVTVMILLHLVFGFVIVINPLCQQIEEALHIPIRKDDEGTYISLHVTPLSHSLSLLCQSINPPNNQLLIHPSCLLIHLINQLAIQSISHSVNIDQSVKLPIKHSSINWIIQVLN